jgi:hypothetical protein
VVEGDGRPVDRRNGTVLGKANRRDRKRIRGSYGRRCRENGRAESPATRARVGSALCAPHPGADPRGARRAARSSRKRPSMNAVLWIDRGSSRDDAVLRGRRSGEHGSVTTWPLDERDGTLRADPGAVTVPRCPPCSDRRGRSAPFRKACGQLASQNLSHQDPNGSPVWDGGVEAPLGTRPEFRRPSDPPAPRTRAESTR